jgi:type I restriction enzyme S subunit
MLIPLPPLAEQKRIVAKIEELLPKVEEYGKAQDALDKLNAELPERLKKSILQEAIEGRLVPQDPNDEPASVLLDKIRAEKAKLVKEGKLKKKDLEETPIQEDEIPFDIPDSWERVRLGSLVSNQTGLSYNKGDLEKKVENAIRVLRGGNIQNGSWCTKADDVMIAPEFVKKPNLSLKKNTFITPAVTSLEHLGKTALITEDHPDIVAGGFVLYLIPHFIEDIMAKYMSYYLQSALYNSYCKSIANKSGQAFWNLSRQKLMDLAIPLPPLAEQKRIVAKIEQLLGEIDKLK